MQNKVNLDVAASYPVCEEFLENIQELAKLYYNPSSINEISVSLKEEIEDCREKIAGIINCAPEEIYFISSASEGNSWAIDGFLKANKDYKIVSTNIEHSSIKMNPNISSFINVDENGIVHPEQFEGYNKTLFCVGYGNSEIGVLSPIKKISEVVHKNDNYLFCDCTQSFSKVKIDVKEMGIDIMTASGHKFGAIKGVGFIYINKDIEIRPIIYGTQNSTMRGSTYNYLAIKSLSIAIDNIDVKKQMKIMNLRNYMLNELVSRNSVITVNGHILYRLPNNLNICIHNLGIDNQQVMILLETNGFIVSAGSACSSGNSKPSHVLKAIGLSDEEVSKSIRITLSEYNTIDEINDFVECLTNIIEMYKEY